MFSLGLSHVTHMPRCFRIWCRVLCGGNGLAGGAWNWPAPGRGPRCGQGRVLLALRLCRGGSAHALDAPVAEPRPRTLGAVTLVAANLSFRRFPSFQFPPQHLTVTHKTASRQPLTRTLLPWTRDVKRHEVTEKHDNAFPKYSSYKQSHVLSVNAQSRWCVSETSTTPCANYNFRNKI